jgi:hypothetical protein
LARRRRRRAAVRLHEIVAVQTVERDGHLHVSHAETRGGEGSYGGGGHTWPVHQIAEYIDKGRDRFYTFAGGHKRDVLIGECPDCGTGNYLYAPDERGENVLLSLG